MSPENRTITMWEMSNGYAQQPHWWDVGFAPKGAGFMWSAGDREIAAMREWCAATTGERNSIFGAWSNMRNTFCFRDRSTFMLFKMRWQGHVTE